MWNVVLALNWAALGLTIPLVWANWKWRTVFPLNGRATPLSVMGLAILCACFFLQGLTYSAEIPCYWHYFLHFSGLPMIFWTIMVRGTRLLFQFELTSDLGLLEQRRLAPAPTIAAIPATRASIAGSTPAAVASSRYMVRTSEPVEPATHKSGLAGWKASWYTNHHYLIKPALIIKMTIAFYVTQISLWLALSFTLGGDRNRCGFPETQTYSNVGTWVTIAFVAIAMVPIAVLGWKLKRHPVDGFGIRLEFSFMVIGVTIPIIAALIVMAFGRTEAVRSRGLDLCIFWGMTVTVLSLGIWPLLLARRHDQLQRGKQAQLASAEKLDQLLAIPEGFHAFLLFCGSEFCSEGLLFWQRISEYRTLAPANALVTLTHTLPPSPLMGAATSSTVAIPDSPAVARTPNMGGPRVLANGSVPFNDRQPLLTVDTSQPATGAAMSPTQTDDNNNNKLTSPNGNSDAILSPTDMTSPILQLMRSNNGTSSSSPHGAVVNTSPAASSQRSIASSRQSLPRHTPSPMASLPPSSPFVALSPRAVAAVGAIAAVATTPTATPKLGAHMSATAGAAILIDAADIPAWMLHMLQESIRIYETYCAPGSPFEINVGSNVRSKIEHQLLRIKSALNYHTGDTPRSLSRSRTGSTISGGQPGVAVNIAGDSSAASNVPHLRVPMVAGNHLPAPSQLTLPGSSPQGTPIMMSHGNGAAISGVSSSSLFPPSPSLAPSSGGGVPSAAVNASNAVINVAHTAPVAGATTARSVVMGGGMTLVEVYHELRTIFDIAQAQSYALMEANSWNRFRTSNFFQQFLSSFQGWTTGAIRKRSGALSGDDDDNDDRSTTGGGVGNRWQMGNVAPSSRGHGKPASHAISPTGGNGATGGHGNNGGAARDIRNSVGAAQAMAAFTSGVGGVAAANRVTAAVHAQHAAAIGGSHNSGSGGSGGSGGHGTRGGGAAAGGHTNNKAATAAHGVGSVLSSGGSPVFSDAAFNQPTGTFVTTSTGSNTPTHHNASAAAANGTSVVTLTSGPSSSPPPSTGPNGTAMRRVAAITATTTIAPMAVSSPPSVRSNKMMVHTSSDAP